MNNGETESRSVGERRGEAWRRAEASRMPCEMHTREKDEQRDAISENERGREAKLDGEKQRGNGEGEMANVEDEQDESRMAYGCQPPYTTSARSSYMTNDTKRQF